jgi:hypothetical protein
MRAMPRPISLSLARLRRPLNKSLAAKILISLLNTIVDPAPGEFRNAHEETKIFYVQTLIPKLVLKKDVV